MEQIEIKHIDELIEKHITGRNRSECYLYLTPDTYKILGIDEYNSVKIRPNPLQGLPGIKIEMKDDTMILCDMSPEDLVTNYHLEHYNIKNK